MFRKNYYWAFRGCYCLCGKTGPEEGYDISATHFGRQLDRNNHSAGNISKVWNKSLVIPVLYSIINFLKINKKTFHPFLSKIHPKHLITISLESLAKLLLPLSYFIIYQNYKNGNSESIMAGKGKDNEPVHCWHCQKRANIFFPERINTKNYVRTKVCRRAIVLQLDKN